MSQLTLKLPKLQPEWVLQAMSEVYDWGLQDLHIPDIHKETLGEDVSIAVIDSGKSEHFEIEKNTFGAQNFSKSDEVEDRNGHSTFVSGIIAAEKNYEGIIGVAPKSKIYFVKAIDDSGNGSPTALAQSILWSTKKKIDIISISAGMFIDFKPLKQAVQKAYKNNIIIIAATGNTGSRHYDVAFPARYPEVIGVAAYDQKHNAAPFSSRGVNVSFAMPGVDVYSTWLDNQFCKNNGTSFAAPMLSGICALILSKHKKLGNASKTPCKTPKQMLEHLNKYAIKIGDDPTATGFGTIDMRSMFADDESGEADEFDYELPEFKPAVKIAKPRKKPKPKRKRIHRKRRSPPKLKRRKLRSISRIKFQKRRRIRSSRQAEWRARRGRNI